MALFYRWKLVVIKRLNITSYINRAVLFISVLIISCPSALALDPEQKKVFDKGISYYNVAVCTPEQDIAPGAGSPTGTQFPALDPNAMAEGINKYIEKVNPDSKLKGLGATIVAGAQNSNINPFLIVSIAQKESGLANPSDYNVSNGNNSFGRTASAGQPNFSGARLWYKWSTVKASVDHTAPENKGSKSGDIASYIRNSGFYDSALKTDDLTKLMTTYAPPSENDTSQYIREIKSWTKRMIRLTQHSAGNPAVSATGDVDSNLSSECNCSNSNESLGKTVVIDPGHGPRKTTTDIKTGLKMIETNNSPETQEVWEVSQKTKEKLEKKGYKVILTKKSIDDDVTFRDRANTADDNNAAIAVSVHGDPGLDNPGEIYAQKVGLYRGSGSNKTTFSNQEIADKSQEYAEKFRQEREKAEGGKIVLKDNSFSGRGAVEPGNIPMVELFSKTPWVYNERKMNFNNDDYAQGIANGVIAALGDSGGDTSSEDCPTGGNGDLAGTVKSYAWPEYHSPPYFKMKPAYSEAVKKAISKGQYVGGGSNPGIDCGGFVTRAMIDSGFEPKYNSSGKGGNTLDQEAWLKNNWKKIDRPTTRNLQLGDVAINSGHTFIYVGEVDGFNSKIASASYSTTGLSWRTPMAGHETPADTSFNWYRKN